MNILVTGATGFIGSHLCRRLVKDGHNVTGTTCHNNPYRISDIIKDIDYQIVDVRDEQDVIRTFINRRIDTVFHLASLLPYSGGDDFIGINIVGTKNILEISREYNVAHFVYSSSNSVYKPNNILPTKERHSTIPKDIYGFTKLAGELLCQVYYDNPIILRYTGVYGKHMDDRVVQTYTHLALKNFTLPIDGNGRQTGDYTYIDDVIDGTILAWQKGDGVYNIGSGKETTIQKLAETIIKITNSQSSIEKGVESTHNYSCLDISKAKRQLGYNPRSLEEGLKTYVESLDD